MKISLDCHSRGSGNPSCRVYGTKISDCSKDLLQWIPAFAGMTRHWCNLLASVLVIIILFFPEIAHAQSINLDLGNATSGSAAGRLIQIIALMTVLSLAPSILVMVTSFTRIMIVLSFLRNAMGIQQTPPNQVLISLAMFLTFFIMTPTFEQAYNDGVAPLIADQITEQQALERIVVPFKDFMLKFVREKDLRLFMDMAGEEKVDEPQDTPLRALVPAFMISELKRAFEIGFLIFIPFIVIDMLVASILMAMGMMMLPPVMISLPFKIIFFVLIDGWYMLCGSLVRSFGY